MKKRVAFVMVWLASLFLSACCKQCPPPEEPPPPVVIKVHEPCLQEPPPDERNGAVVPPPACVKPEAGLVACMDTKTALAISHNLAKLRAYAKEAWNRCGDLHAKVKP